MKITEKFKLPEWLTAISAFIYYWIISLYKLTQAPIWQDEAMEFYCSIPIKGEIRGVTKYATMYERMAYIQQQPPLYNWIMCLWLQVSEGEWWYRLSSVVFGFGAVVGLYFIVKKLCSKYAAAFSVVILSSIYIYQYYLKEASEYSMLIMILTWLIYDFILLMETANTKRLVTFVVLSILAVFTQYGAVFVVVPFAIYVFVQLCKNNEKKLARICAMLYGIAVLFGGIPLLILYIVPQSTNQVSTLFSEKEIIIERGSIFGDFLNSLMCVFRFFAIDFDRDWEKIYALIVASMIVIAVIMMFSLIKTQKKVLRQLFICNVFSYLLYYTITKLNIYAYGWYGNRYNLFLLPFWYVMIFATLYELWIIIKEKKIATVYKASLIIMGLLYCIYGDYRVSNHWLKMDLRTVVATWYDNDGYEVPTLLDFHQRYGFVYYFTHNDRYDESQWKNIVYNDVVGTSLADDEQVWKEYLNSVYGDELPSEIYVVTGQWNTLVDTFVELGYSVEPVVDTTAELYLMKK
jgi:4-amino-4-deoxy-L-arabinose transferase-like glycosyltransferase